MGNEGVIPPHYLNAVVTGDALTLLATLPDQCAAFAFADPPYWVNYNYGERKDSEMTYIDPVLLTEQLQRVARVVCITPGMRHFYNYPKADWLLGWFKPGSTRQSGVLGFNTWEPVLLYGKPSRGLWQDAINLPDAVNHTKDGSFHACPKPLRLLAWLIEGLTKPGELVIDPVAGSGTTCVAAKMLGRQYIAFEIDPTTADNARQRILNTQPPLPLVYDNQLELSFDT